MKVTYREKKKVKFRISFIFLFIIASFAACFTFYMKEDFVITEDMFVEENNSVVYIEPTGQSSGLINPVPKSERADEEFYNDTVFIGSKVLAGLSDYEYTNAQNMLLSDSIKLSNFNTVILSENNVERTISEAALSRKPKNIYIMIGLYELNNINDSIFSQLEEFIDKVHNDNSDINIYLMSVLPVTAEAEASVASNADIDAYNSLLLKFADKKQVSYLDINTSLKGNDGKLPASSAEINGVRLTKEQYGNLSEYILTHTVE